MGWKRSCLWISMMFCFFIFSFVESSKVSPASLDSILQDYAFDKMLNSHTGYLYNVSIPANLSGIEASVIRLRSGSFWTQGVNHSLFHLPPGIIPIPFVKRLIIVYQNLGNQSSLFYNMKGYSLVTPVIGFKVYDSLSMKVLELAVTANPISIRFPKSLIPDRLNSTLKCVRYGNNGTMVFSKMRLPNVCFTEVQGHFSIVMRSVERKKKEKKNDKKMDKKMDKKKDKKKEKIWKSWVIWFVFGFLGLVLIGFIWFVVVRFVRMKKMGEMEKQADDGEAFDTFWIGNSKMPSATVIRTQPVLDYRGDL